MFCGKIYANSNQQFKYFNSTDFKRQVQRISLEWDEENSLKCQLRPKFSPIEFKPVRALKFTNFQTYPVRGLGIFKYRFSHCDLIRDLSIIVDATSGRSELIPFLPGNTKIGMYMFLNSFRPEMNSISLAKKRITSCESSEEFKVLDTAISIDESLAQTNKNVESFWEEKWDVEFCGQKIFIPICFVKLKANNSVTWFDGECDKLKSKNY